ncbi:MAG TPA: hypothetical protein VGP15_15195 [Burkholderiales bacterium]|nr:hypothetical protein [Burkholderiales bacterium]
MATACASAAEAPSVTQTLSVALSPLPAAANVSHALALHLYSFRGTRWNADAIVDAVAQSAALLATCGVALTRAELHIIEAPRPFHFYDTPLSRELLRALPVEKPAVFFVEDTRNQPAFDAEAIGLRNSATRPELANTVWVAYGSRDLPVVLAHELVHVLADSGEHSDEPGNLMGEETSPDNTRLSPRQCERLRTHAEANGLLSRYR